MNKNLLTGAITFGAATLLFGAAALAQTPSPTPGMTPTVVPTGTVQTTGTAVATGTAAVTGTVVATGTVAVIPTIAVPGSLYQAGGEGDFPFAHPAFENVWNRTDRLVQEGKVSRTWFWGPGPNTPGLMEAYREAPGGGGMRLVQYFDKSRMELNDPQANPSQPFFVTNGLLTVDLISGSVQVGNNDFTRYRNACIPMTGDFGDNLAPTYFAFQRVSVSADRVDTHPAENRVGQRITETIDRTGNTGTDPAKANVPGIEVAQYITETRHNIPRVFWDFLNSSGDVYNAQGQVVREQLIVPWFYAAGLPISEPYWTRATIKGQATDVLIQAFERRALTYVPTNPEGFQVEMANIGQHYFDWRYRNAGFCPGQPATTPTPPVPAVTGTPMATGTVPVGATTTAVGTGTPMATGTVVATGTAQATGTAEPTSTVVATGTIRPQGTPVPGP